MKKFLITEEEKNRILKMYINEQLTLLSIPPVSISMSTGDNAKQILLKGTDPKTKQTLILKYNIQGEIKGIGFDVNLRNISRISNGDLNAEAYVDNWMARKAILAIAPSDKQTSDGWLKIWIPNSKIQDAINQLRNNRGQSANIDAGYGVTIKLSNA